MSKSMSRIAAGAVALAFVAGTASAQLEYYALTTDGSLHYVNGGVDTVVGNTGLNNTVNSLALSMQSRGGSGDLWASQGFTTFGPPTGTTGTVNASTAAYTNKYTLSDSDARLPLGGGIAIDADGSVWQMAQNFAGSPNTLYHHDAAGNLISAVDVGILGTVGALALRSDGEMIVGDSTGKIYVVNKTTGNISSSNQTGLVGLTEFSTGARAKDGFFSGSAFTSTFQDVAYAVTNSGGVASIYRINLFGNNISIVETLNTMGTGNVWGLQVVPTPASAALLGLGGLFAGRRRRH